MKICMVIYKSTSASTITTTTRICSWISIYYIDRYQDSYLCDKNILKHQIFNYPDFSRNDNNNTVIKDNIKD